MLINALEKRMINEVFNHADDFEPYHSSFVKLQRDDGLIKTTPREDDAQRKEFYEEIQIWQSLVPSMHLQPGEKERIHHGLDRQAQHATRWPEEDPRCNLDQLRECEPEVSAVWPPSRPNEADSNPNASKNEIR